MYEYMNSMMHVVSIQLEIEKSSSTYICLLHKSNIYECTYEV